MSEAPAHHHVGALVPFGRHWFVSKKKEKKKKKRQASHSFASVVA